MIDDDADDRSGLTEAELARRERLRVPFHVLVNPVLEAIGDEKANFYEGCLSVEGYAAAVLRHKHVRVTALDERGEEFSREASGWYARILQHEVDHLNGTLYIDRMDTRTFSTVENRSKFSG